ncbi:MAG: acetyl/propionyl/methylcrotonyl-CoA carboxylase subunit alpha [Mangrovibacterium sp.]
MKKKFWKILVANRGEIAVRIIRTARIMGIRTAAVYAADDALSLHVARADEAFLLDGNTLAETYLNQQALLALALQIGADAIHPGYGFLSENAAFAAAVEHAGIHFIGATPEQISLMGEKTRAIEFVRSLGVPVLPGLYGSASEIRAKAETLDFPVLVKAAAGGGGKGMQIVQKAADLEAALEQAGRQATAYFGQGELFVEKYLQKARHVEVQLMGDGKGKVVHLFERDCSLQRRYQKVVEEAPAPNLLEETRHTLHHDALQIAKAANYRGAGTIEFLVDEQQQCWFLEMNTRLQVEHPVTEAVTGLDLVEWQIEIAAGNGLPLKQEDIRCGGHAIEARICAEDPALHFVPSSGVIGAVQAETEARWDSFVVLGSRLSPAYDSLLGKLIVHRPNRTQAIAALNHALDNLFLGGIKTNQAFLKKLIMQDDFASMQVYTQYIEQHLPRLLADLQTRPKTIPSELAAIAFILHHFYSEMTNESVSNVLGYWRLNPLFELQIDGKDDSYVVRRRKNEWIFERENEPLRVNDVSYYNHVVSFKLNGKRCNAFWIEKEQATEIQIESYRWELKSRQVPDQIKLNRRYSGAKNERQSRILADLFGKVIDVFVAPGDKLVKGQHLLLVESMKTEFSIQSPVDAVVKAVYVTKGKMVQDREVLIDLE